MTDFNEIKAIVTAMKSNMDKANKDYSETHDAIVDTSKILETFLSKIESFGEERFKAGQGSYAQAQDRSREACLS